MLDIRSILASATIAHTSAVWYLRGFEHTSEPDQIRRISELPRTSEERLVYESGCLDAVGLFWVRQLEEPKQ